MHRSWVGWRGLWAARHPCAAVGVVWGAWDLLVGVVWPMCPGALIGLGGSYNVTVCTTLCDWGGAELASRAAGMCWL